MAFLPNAQDQSQQNTQQNQVPTVPQIPTLQGTSGPTASSSAGTGSTNTAAPGAAPSSPWQNITSYLSANAGQAGNVANVLAGNLQNQYNQTNQAIGQAQQNFGQQIEGARNPLNQDISSRAATSPGQFAQNPNDVAAFQKMYSGNYAGPQNFSGTADYSGLQSKVQGAQKNAALVNQGSEGLMTLLQQAEAANGKNPTQGMTSLDSLLLLEDPSNYSKLSGAAAPYSGLTNYLSSTQQGLDTAAQKAAQEAAATGSTLQNQFTGPGGVAPTMQAKLDQELQGASKQATGFNQQIADIIGKLNSGQPLTIAESHQVDPAGTLQSLNPFGTSTGIFQNMLGTGMPGIAPGMLAQFYNAPQQLQQPGLQNVMSPQEFADAQAINQLTGQSAVGVPASLGQRFVAPQAIGSFDDQGALKALYDTMQNDESVLPDMSSDQQRSWLIDSQALASFLGLPSPYQGPPIQPVSAPASPFPGDSSGLTGGTNTTTSGGGRAFR